MRGLYKNFVFDITVALIALALGVVMLPVFGISAFCIDILLAIALAAYLVLFLLDKLRHTRGIVFALTVLEFGLLLLLALALVIQQFSPAHFISVCQVVGVVLWLRGAIMTITLYISALYIKKPRRNLTALAISIVMISVGVWMISSSLLTDLFLEWVMCIALFITALVFGALAFLFYKGGEKKTEKK